MTMRILTPNGAPAPPAPTEAKKAHDPAETTRFETILKNLYKECMQGFGQEMNSEKHQDLLQKDHEKVRDYYHEKWCEQAVAINATGFPHKVDADKVKNDIDAAWRKMHNEMNMAKPMESIDLDVYELRVLGEISTGTLWISDVCAVSVHPDGLCRVWTRKPGEDLETWASEWLPEPARSADVECVQYTMNELHHLLTSLRVARIAPLPEPIMNQARKHERRNWWQRP